MVYCRFQKDDLSLGRHPVPLLWVQSLRSRRELEFSLTLRTLYVNTALRVATERFLCIRVLQAHISNTALRVATENFCGIFVYSRASGSLLVSAIIS